MKLITLTLPDNTKILVNPEYIISLTKGPWDETDILLANTSKYLYVKETLVQIQAKIS